MATKRSPKLKKQDSNLKAPEMDIMIAELSNLFKDKRNLN